MRSLGTDPPQNMRYFCDVQGDMMVWKASFTVWKIGKNFEKTCTLLKGNDGRWYNEASKMSEFLKNHNSFCLFFFMYRIYGRNPSSRNDSLIYDYSICFSDFSQLNYLRFKMKKKNIMVLGMILRGSKTTSTDK